MRNLLSMTLLHCMLVALCCLQGIASAAVVLDETFKPVLSAAGTITGLAPLPTGGQVMVVGKFTAINGISCKNIARLNIDGSVDTSFSLSTEFTADSIDAVAIQPDGKILIGGLFTYYGATSSRNYLFRLNTDGSWDKSFDAGGFAYATGPYGLNGPAKALSVDSSGMILVGGEFTEPKNYIVRLNVDGSQDTTFDPGTGPNGTVTHISRQTNGGIIIGGAFSSINGTAKQFVARLGANGALDTLTFGTGLYGGGLQALAVQSDDKVLIGGSFFMLNGQPVPKLVRTSSSGVIDNSFLQAVPQFGGGSIPAADYFVAITSLLSLPDKIIVGGWNPIMYFNGKPTDHNAQIFVLQGSDGAFVSYTQFKGKPTDVWALAKRSDGGVIAGGSFTQLDDGSEEYFYGLCCLTGQYYTPTAAFKPIIGGQAEVRSLVQQSDGKIIAGGDFLLANGTRKNGIARFSPDGSLDQTLTVPTQTGGTVSGVLVRDDDNIIIAGSFYSIGGQDYTDIALLSPTGTFLSGSSVGSVNSLAWYSGNKIMASTPYSPGIRRLNADLTNDSTFNPGTGISNSQQPDFEFDRINTVAVQKDGKILIGGSFSSFNGSACQNILRLNEDGSIDASFSSPTFTVFNLRSELFSLALQADGKILIAGRFSTVNGTSRPTVARLNSDGSLDTTFQTPFADQGSSAYIISVQNDGKVLVGGSIQLFDANNIYNSLARLNPDGSRDTSFNFSTTGVVKSILVKQSGQILAGGAIEAVNGSPRFSLAQFSLSAPQSQLTVTKSGSGSGSVVPDFGSITWNGVTGTAMYDTSPQSVVILTATANPGSVFTGWAGEGCSGTGTCVVTMTDSRIVTAVFTQQSYRLTVDATSGNGSGTIISTAPDTSITCPGTCSANYPAGTLVSLKAYPSWYSTISWTGCNQTGDTCTLTMDADNTISAIFNHRDNVRYGGNYYGTLKQAYSAVVSGGVIQARDSSFVIFAENELSFDKNYDVTLEGGKDANWQSIPGGFTTINGSLKIVQGKATIHGIRIQ